MGLNHDFFIVENNTGYEEALDLSKNSYTVQLHDNIIDLIFETVKWIPSIWFDPHTVKEISGMGFEEHSLARFEGDGLKKLVKILKLWVKLFEEATDIISCYTGDFFEEGVGSVPTYDRFDKADVIKKTNAIIDLANDAISTNKSLIQMGV